MRNLSPANEARLRAAIAERGLQAAEELIVASAVECATLYTTGPDEAAQIGASRYGGVPDFPDETWWPKTSDGTFYQFMMQVNLAEVPDFAGKLLPPRGMLYAFLADYDDIAKDWAIRWADTTPNDLRRMEPKPTEQIAGWYEDEESFLPPFLIVAQAGIDVPRWYSIVYGRIEESVVDSTRDEDDESYDERWEAFEETYHEFSITTRNLQESMNWVAKLSGYLFYIGSDPNEDGRDGREVPEGYVLLMSFFSDRAVGVTFGDAGYVQLFIDPVALAARDFSWVFARMESS